MSDANKAIVSRFAEAFSRRDFASLQEVCSADVASRFIASIEQGPFGDHQVTITDSVAEEDRVWSRVATRGTHRGEWLGIPATGRRWTNTGVLFLRVSGGRITEVNGLFDEVNLLRQLGATITPSA